MTPVTVTLSVSEAPGKYASARTSAVADAIPPLLALDSCGDVCGAAAPPHTGEAGMGAAATAYMTRTPDAGSTEGATVMVMACGSAVADAVAVAVRDVDVVRLAREGEPEAVTGDIATEVEIDGDGEEDSARDADADVETEPLGGSGDELAAFLMLLAAIARYSTHAGS